MKLKEYIAWLEKRISIYGESERWKYGLGEPDSYRGIYADCMFQIVEGVTTGEMLKSAKWAINLDTVGYKGGDYMITLETPCWVDNYGQAHEAALTEDVLNCLLVFNDWR